MGAKDRKYFADKTGKKPVIFIIGAEHGDELEGTVAILNWIKMIETGTDFKGETIPYLRDCINDCRLLLIPIANPDGRARMTIDTLVGVDMDTFLHFAQGRWHDGTFCRHLGGKSVHPIKNAVSHLGSYYNDDGINIAHDDFFGKMASETQVLFDIVKREAPDFTLHIHGATTIKHEIECANYTPRPLKELVQELKYKVRDEADRQGLKGKTLTNQIRNEDNSPPFALYSAIHHACGTLSITVESNQGVLPPEDHVLEDSWETMMDEDEIMRMQYILYEQTIRHAHELRNTGKW